MVLEFVEKLYNKNENQTVTNDNNENNKKRRIESMFSNTQPHFIVSGKKKEGENKAEQGVCMQCKDSRNKTSTKCDHCKNFLHKKCLISHQDTFNLNKTKRN